MCLCMGMIDSNATQPGVQGHKHILQGRAKGRAEMPPGLGALTSRRPTLPIVAPAMTCSPIPLPEDIGMARQRSLRAESHYNAEKRSST